MNVYQQLSLVYIHHSKGDTETRIYQIYKIHKTNKAALTILNISYALTSFILNGSCCYKTWWIRQLPSMRAYVWSTPTKLSRRWSPTARRLTADLVWPGLQLDLMNTMWNSMFSKTPESPGLSFSVSYKAPHLFKWIEKSNSAILFNVKAVILFSATFPLFVDDHIRNMNSIAQVEFKSDLMSWSKTGITVLHAYLISTYWKQTSDVIATSSHSKTH